MVKGAGPASGLSVAPPVASSTASLRGGEVRNRLRRPAHRRRAQLPLTRSIRAGITVTVLYGALALALFWHIWASGPAGSTERGPDVYQTVWFLAAVPHALFGGHNPFFLTVANHPYGVNTLSNTSVPLLGVLGYPVTLAFGPVATFNLWITASPALSALATYVFARRLTDWRPAAFVAGLVFGFSPYEVVESFDGHLNLSFLFLVPLVFLLLHELVVRQRANPLLCGGLLGLLLAAQFFVSAEVLATTVVLGVVAVVIVAAVGWRSWRGHLAHAVAGGALAAVVAVALLAYPAWFVQHGPDYIRGQIQLEPQAYRADLAGIVVPDAYLRFATPSAQHQAADFANSAGENGSYLGLPFLVVVLGGLVWLRRRPVVWVLGLLALVAFVLSLGGALTVTGAPHLGPHGEARGLLGLPEAIFGHLPAFDNIVPVRIALFVALFAGLLLGVVLDELHRAGSRAARRAGGEPRSALARLWGLLAPTAVAVVCLLPLVPRGISASGPASVPSYFATRAANHLRPGSVTVLVPFPSEVYYQSQFWQAAGSAPFRFTIPGGYFLTAEPGKHHTIAFIPGSGYFVDSLVGFTLVKVTEGHPPPESPALRALLLRQLRAWHVANLVAPMDFVPHARGTYQFLVWLLGRPSSVGAQHTASWYDVARVDQAD